MSTGFFTDERCFWHGGGNYAGNLPVGGFVQPLAAGGLPEGPEAKRRLKNLLEVSGLMAELQVRGGAEASREDLLRVHPAAYLDRFKEMSDAGGGEIGLRAPFGQGGYEIAAVSARLASAALAAVMRGDLTNAYALSRPPGHHCLPDWPNGFCLLNNIGVAIRAAQAAGLGRRFAVLDWDVHHGNGTEAVFIDDADVLAVSLHQERNYPLDTGGFDVRGEGAGRGANLNIPLPPGTGHAGYMAAMERLALPAIRAHRPDAIVVACGYDSGLNDPLGRMLATAETFRAMTRAVKALADDVCGGRLILVHEGGYAETYVPFCGHAAIEALSATAIRVPDPFADAFARRQPGPAFDRFVEEWIGGMEQALAGGA
ncbi:class II histone deacetylase [Wenxinia marina]|uniref:Deacetylase n=1 Tax=Wenxinia marina DSM 24838 TaxID=1123501 RepID=A0A0D0QF48_9RHOB|nr:class II histone deacetylase [Wenxinia marina]KIQ69618.1 Deacetylase [Wenxinia marina DSM 24838]GGL59786.1 class II histone deacetylase [Wenxinia marina]